MPSSADACASPTMEKGNLLKWLKKEARRSVGRRHREIENRQATMEVRPHDEAPRRILIRKVPKTAVNNADPRPFLADGEAQRSRQGPGSEAARLCDGREGVPSRAAGRRANR